MSTGNSLEVSLADSHNQFSGSGRRLRQRASRIQLHIRYPHIVFDEEYVFGSAVQDLEAAIIGPWSSRGFRWRIWQELNRDIAKRGCGEIAEPVCKRALGKARFTILQLQVGRRLAWDLIEQLGRSDGHVSEVVVVTMH